MSSTTSTPTTSPTTIQPSGGGGGGGGSQGGGGVHRPTIQQLANGCYAVNNVTQLDTFNVTFSGVKQDVTENFISPTQAGISVNSNPYTLQLNGTANVSSNATSNFVVKLLNISYLPLENTIQLSMCPVLKPGITTTITTTTSVATTKPTTTSVKTTTTVNVVNNTRLVVQAQAPPLQETSLIELFMPFELYIMIGVFIIIVAIGTIVYTLLNSKGNAPPPVESSS